VAHPLATEINVDQLRFDAEIRRRMANLAMSVEIKERKRFSVSRTADQLVGLINESSVSTRPEIMDALAELLSALDAQQKHLLMGIGANLAVRSTAKPELAEDAMAVNQPKYIRGARG
jgi:hypothetical protein